MNLSINWLKTYLKKPIDAKSAADCLTRVGLEVEAIEAVPGDSILSAEVTTNRPDWLSYVGVAREIAAATGDALQLPSVRLAEQGKPVGEMTSVEVLDPELCPRYTARVITGVKVGPSPAWLIQRIESMGLRSVNNVVDITNFVLFECGQPLHAFDYDKLGEHRIVVRRAKPGESITAIDGSRHELKSGELVICDAHRPTAIAGIMGGLDTEVGPATTTVLLESARFQPLNIRRTSRRLALESDSSYRFARGVDPVGVEWAGRRAAALIADVCGGKVCPGIVDVDAAPFKPREVTLRFARIERILGVPVAPEECRKILEALGCETAGADAAKLVMRMPSWRADLEREIDLIEEVARIHGYENIPPAPGVTLRLSRRDETLNSMSRAAQVLNAAGFHECVNISFTDAATAKAFAPWSAAAPIEVRNPIDRDQPGLRTSLVPSLLAARRLNQSRRNKDVRLFEVARVYLPKSAGGLPDERLMLGVVGDVDFRAIKGVVETLLARFGLDEAVKTEELSAGWLSEGLTLKLNGETLGYVGLVSAKMLEHSGLKTQVAAAELDFDRLMREAKPAAKFRELPRFPAVDRDLAVVVDDTVRWTDVLKVVEGQKLSLLESVSFMSEFRGKSVGEGKKSLAFSMIFRAPDRTLTHEEADAAQAAVLDALTGQLGATLRK